MAKIPHSKLARVLRALLERPHSSRELELAPVFDHCAHSTVSDLRAEGIKIATQRIMIPGYGGAPAYVARWSIAPESRHLAEQLLEVRSRGERRHARR